MYMYCAGTCTYVHLIWRILPEHVEDTGVVSPLLGLGLAFLEDRPSKFTCTYVRTYVRAMLPYLLSLHVTVVGYCYIVGRKSREFY